MKLTNTTLRLLDLYKLNDFHFSCDKVAQAFIEMVRAEKFEKHLAEVTAKHIYK